MVSVRPLRREARAFCGSVPLTLPHLWLFKLLLLAVIATHSGVRAECVEPAWVGDGFCDDATNGEEVSFAAFNSAANQPHGA